MKEFLKKNLLLILVLFFGYAAYCFATTYSRPGGTTQYVGGEKAVGPAVDADFNSIVNWLNTANISSANIASGGVAQSNIASGAVGPSQLAAANLTVTNSSSLQQISSATPVQLNSMSITTTVSGSRPVRVSIEPYPGSSLSAGNSLFYSYIQLNSISGSSFGNVFIVRDSATTGSFTTFLSNTGGTTIPCAFSEVETPLAGSHTWQAFGSVTNGQSLFIFNCRLVVEEL